MDNAENKKGPCNAYSAMCAVMEYVRDFRRPDLTALDLGELYDLFSGAEPGRPGRPNTYPHAERAGVYFVLDDRLNLLYVGKASMGSCIGKRLGSYFTYAPDGGCQVLHDGWSSRPRYVATIAVPENAPFEAPALEEFLISRLNPPDNKTGTTS